MPIRRTRIEDHRGRPAKLFRSGVIFWRYPGEHAVAPAIWKRIRRDVIARMSNDVDVAERWFLRVGRFCAALILLGIAGLAVFSVAQLIRYPNQASILIFFGPVIVLYSVINQYFSGYPANAPMYIIQPILLDHGLCVQCGYFIKGLPPEPDGCTVCPECGAAWKLPTCEKPNV